MLRSPDDSSNSIFTDSLDSEFYSVKKSESSSEYDGPVNENEEKFGSLMNLMYSNPKDESVSTKDLILKKINSGNLENSNTNSRQVFSQLGINQNSNISSQVVTRRDANPFTSKKRDLSMMSGNVTL